MSKPSVLRLDRAARIVAGTGHPLAGRVPSAPDRCVTTNPTVADPSAETTFDRGRDLTRRAALSAAARLLGLIIAAVLSLSPVSARAQIYWQVPAGDWSTVANWGSVVPTGTDAAYIVNGGTATVTQLNATCGTLSLGGSTGSGSVQMTGGSLSVNCDETVGDSWHRHLQRSPAGQIVSPMISILATTLAAAARTISAATDSWLQPT